MARPERYQRLLELIDTHKPRTILEIGTWNGQRAIEMATKALKYQSSVHYIGYDLFEEASDETDKKELNVKKHFTEKEVGQKLQEFARNNSGFTFELHKGNTNDVLNEQSVDFAFIDGGHSVETITADYEKVKNSKVIAFDDYYIANEQGVAPNIKKWGANAVVDLIPGAEVFPSTDGVKQDGKPVGYTCIAVVVNKGKDAT